MQPQSTQRGTRTKEDMFVLIARHDKSTTTVKEFCQLHGLTQGIFYYWQKKYHTENSEPGWLLSHARIMKLQFENDSVFEIRFDQGMGYWTAELPNQDYPFNFTVSRQLQWLNQYAGRITVQGYQNYPTHLFLKYEGL